MRSFFCRGITPIILAALFTLPAQAGVKGGDVNIGIDPDSGQLVALWGGELVQLPEINGPLFGFGIDEPGFFTITDSVVGLVPPEAGANLVLDVITFDDALKGWRPGFAGFFDDPGETWDIGSVPFDDHPFWHIDSNDPGFVPPPGQTAWNATFRILDTGSTGYLPSEALTVTFTPEPTSLAILLVISALSRRVSPRKGR
ncbi:MAG TPA: hypothetical protein VJZ71_12530 [Phycisphaerae bacterium]|nr:hypothetical protein [Phycisphaerae bacterium]